VIARVRGQTILITRDRVFGRLSLDSSSLSVLHLSLVWMLGIEAFGVSGDLLLAILLLSSRCGAARGQDAPLPLPFPYHTSTIPYHTLPYYYNTTNHHPRPP